MNRIDLGDVQRGSWFNLAPVHDQNSGGDREPVSGCISRGQRLPTAEAGFDTGISSSKLSATSIEAAIKAGEVTSVHGANGYQVGNYDILGAEVDRSRKLRESLL